MPLLPAAVEYVSASNPLTFMNTIPPYWEPQRRQFHAMVGVPVADEARLESESNEENQLEFYDAMEQFLATCLKP